jgi:hypothetical protein
MYDKSELNEIIIGLMKEDNVSLREDGRPYKKNARSEYSHADLMSLWDDEDFSPSRKDFNDAVDYWQETRTSRISDSRDRFPTDVSVWIKQYLDDNGYFIDENGVFMQEVNGVFTDVSMPALKSQIYLEIHQDNLRRIEESDDENRIPPLDTKKELQEATISVMITQKTKNREQELKALITHDPDIVFDLDAWINDVFGIYGLNKNRKESVHMFKQMLWTIKRHIFCKRVDFRFMFVFYSAKQGIGKTEMLILLNRLWPNKYLANASLSKLVEPKEMKAMLNGYVACDFQELAKATEEGMAEALKRAITAKDITGRDNYANIATTQYSRTCLLASSNLSVGDVFSDSTGMRRYFEFYFDPKDKHPYHNLDGHFDVDTLIKVYKSINENDDIGFYSSEKSYEYADIIRSIENIQEEYVNVDDKITMYCRNTGIEIYRGVSEDPIEIDKEGFKLQKLETFRRAYLRWLDKNGYKSWNISTIRNVLKNRHFLIQFNSDTKGEYEVIYVREKVKVSV